jgi:hypothetical protein
LILHKARSNDYFFGNNARSSPFFKQYASGTLGSFQTNAPVEGKSQSRQDTTPQRLLPFILSASLVLAWLLGGDGLDAFDYNRRAGRCGSFLIFKNSRKGAKAQGLFPFILSELLVLAWLLGGDGLGASDCSMLRSLLYESDV